MKKNQKGFLLTEVLIVITFVSVILFYLFVQFNSLFNHYERSFRYNSVSGLYRAKEVKKFLLSVDFSELIYGLNEGELYIEFSNCNFVVPSNYCLELMADLEIKTIYFVHEDVTGFSTYVKNQPKYGDLINYIDYVGYHRDYVGYRIIIEFNDDEFASINFL